jgi:hypothetical protein
MNNKPKSIKILFLSTQIVQLIQYFAQKKMEWIAEIGNLDFDDSDTETFRSLDVEKLEILEKRFMKYRNEIELRYQDYVKIPFSHIEIAWLLTQCEDIPFYEKFAPYGSIRFHAKVSKHSKSSQIVNPVKQKPLNLMN